MTKVMISPSFRAMLRSGFAALALALAAALATGVAPAMAQDPIPPPKHSAVDANGVDLISDAMSVTSGLNSIGPSGPGGLAASKTLRPGFSISSMFSYVKLVGSAEVQETTLVAFMGQSQLFNNTPDIGPEFSEGNTLDKDATHIRYTLADGTVARFKLVHIQYVMNPNMRPAWGVLQSVTYPSGEVLTFTYDVETIGATWMRVESSLGYAIAGTGGMHEWTAEAAANLTQGGCTGSVCSGPTFASQEALGRTPTKSATATTVTISNPAGGAPKVYTTSYNSQLDRSMVTAVSDGAGTWTYTYGQIQDQTFHPLNDKVVVTVTDPLGNKRVVTSRLENQQIISDTVGIKPDGTGGQTTTFQYSDDNVYAGLGRLYQISAPEGNRVFYQYDDQNNVTAKWNLPKGTPVNVDPNTVADATVMRASYNLSLCVNRKICNRPDWIKDERGNQTDFTYDPVHGGVLTVTKPAGPNGVRPQTRYTYGQFTARYIQNGSLTAAPPVWRLTQTSTCAVGAAPACVGTADETIASYTYESSAAANNVRLLSVTTRAGDNSLSATTSYAYDARGDLVAVDGPLAGSADTTRTVHDASRWTTGVIGPDPDGAGPLLHRATRTTYAADGLPTSIDTGTATNPSDTSMSTFAALQQAVPAYDAQRRKVSDTLVVGGAAQAVTQYGYDAAGRQICQAVRMNPAAFASAPGACTLGAQGGDGPDRITYSEYDAADRVTAVYSGYGTTGMRREKKYAYRPNGTIGLITDGENNTTSLSYDGFDRLTHTHYPMPIKGAQQANGTDFEEYGYDAAGNRTSWRRRNGATVTFTYDALNRANNGLRGEVYAYDNQGRRRSATLGGGVSTLTYDALGRVKTETTNGKTLSYQYDLAGRRIQMTWPDNVFVTYDYDGAGQTTNIWQSDGIRVWAVAYDNLGRRVYGWSGPGSPATQTSYAYDAASRLSAFSHDLAGTAQDQTWTFAYNAAGQVKTRAAGNSLYEWAGSQATKSYTVNGLNQYVTAAGAPIAYDLRGNLRSDGARTYCYGDLLNNLSGVWSGAIDCAAPPANPIASLSYEPTGRLWQVTAGATTTNLLYSGPDLVAEYDAAGAVVRRYVPGPGTDAPVIWYEGSGVSDRRFLLANPQGSIVAVTNSAGTSLATNTYDEYGIPAAGNLGRFQYTGQAWIPEVGLYHYKARAYSPTLGRFLQTDPIGYKDGLNWYAYVGNDPVNNEDPTGNCLNCISGGIGAVIGGVTGAGFETAYQLAHDGKISDPTAIGTAGLGGAIGGGVAGATGCLSCGAALGNAVTTGLDSWRDDKKFDGKDAVRTGLASGAGALGAKLIPGANRLNWFGKTQSMQNMVTGRIVKQDVQRIAVKTAVKIGVNEGVKSTVPGTIGKSVDKMAGCALGKEQGGC